MNKAKESKKKANKASAEENPINKRNNDKLKNEGSKKGMGSKEMEKELNDVEEEVEKIKGILNTDNVDEVKREITFSASKPISQVKKGDKVKIDDVEYEVDAHYVLIDHGATKEMTIEIFNPVTDKDLQLRYFDDQVESTLDLYELQEILYVKKLFKKIEW